MNSIYENPLSSRYASSEMLYNFSPDMKFTTWRKLWVSLAKAERKLGLDITDEQIKQMQENIDNIDYKVVKSREKEVRHDVMAHVYAFSQVCPLAEPIIHLGATSAYVGDNTDIIQMREGLKIIRTKLVSAISQLSKFALAYKDLPCLGFTHFQPAQLTTVGKRATLWINEFMMDLDEIEYRLDALCMLGSKGTTGTQASFLELFDGDHDKVLMLERLIAEDFGFKKCVPVSGQTYSRKIDAGVLATLSGVAQSAGKFATDMRLLQHLRELEEPFEAHQIGSSAMPYKRNPMRSERVCALARYVIIDALNPAMTSYNQWFERTLDDSANKRISIAEAFLAVDAILNIVINISSDIVVYEKVITNRVMAELPFMATENIMMSAVKRGGNRQELHERIRVHSIEAGKAIKQEGLSNDMVDRISNDKSFGLTKEEILKELEPKNYVGRSKEQVEEFINAYVLTKISVYQIDNIKADIDV